MEKLSEIQKEFQVLNRLYIYICNWKGIGYSSKVDGWKTFGKNNPTIALNILHIKEKEICSAYISKVNSICKKQTAIIKVSNKEQDVCHYLAVKVLPILSRGITSKHHGDFCYFNCLYSFITENNLKSL